MDFLAYLLVALLLYFIPWIIASNRGHQNSGAIFMTNLLLGWTGVGWVFALIWAMTSNTDKSAAAGSASAGRKSAPVINYDDDDDDEDLEDIIEFRAAGVTMDTPDGVSRQKLLEKCKISTAVKLERDPDNDYDRNAVKIMTKISGKWHHIGFVPAEDSRMVAQIIDGGHKYTVQIAQRTGGTEDYPSYGLLLELEMAS